MRYPRKKILLPSSLTGQSCSGEGAHKMQSTARQCVALSERSHWLEDATEGSRHTSQVPRYREARTAC